MAVQTITYDDKSYLNQNSDIADVNKVNDTDMNEIKAVVNNNANELNNEMNHQYIVATINSSQTITTNSQVIFNQSILNQGNFTLLNGNVVIGENINHVRISGSIFVENWAGSTNYLWNRVKKNSTYISGSINGSTGSFLSASIPYIIIDVEENDTLSLIADSPSGGSLRSGASNTWLCVERID